MVPFVSPKFLTIPFLTLTLAWLVPGMASATEPDPVRASLRSLQDEWATIFYKLPESQQAKKFKHLLKRGRAERASGSAAMDWRIGHPPYGLVFWTTGLAYITATLFYQAGTYALHPVASTFWIGGFLAFLLALVGLLRHLGNRAIGSC